VKRIISLVFPGVFEENARFFFLQMLEIKLDLPAFDAPKKAIWGRSSVFSIVEIDSLDQRE
jgi:hypothetical protein